MYIKFYKTKDLNMATVLFSVGCKIDSTEWKGTELYWIFEDEKKCLKIETKYMRKELKIEPQNLFQSNRYIRGLIYN
ncbi:hypothetical protein EOM09_01620 [bacterium]|nr:hypothetical protein [bacterium]